MPSWVMAAQPNADTSQNSLEAKSVAASETRVESAGKPTFSGDLSTKSDSELTQLTAQWSHLNPSERRKLLAEVRGRMAANRQARRPIDVRVQRRYGRIVRKPDGSVVLQTRLVQMRPNHPVTNGTANGNVIDGRTVKGAEAGEPTQLTASAATTQVHPAPRRRVTFGFGFERRIKSRNQPPTDTPSKSVVLSEPPATDTAP